MASLANQPVKVEPSILVWARETMGLSQSDVAKRIKKDEKIVSEWESGELLPTFSQLEKLAYQIYKRPLVVFFLPEPPKETTVKEDFRTIPDQDISALSPDVRLVIRKTKHHQVGLKEIYSNKNPAEHQIHKDLSFRVELNIVQATTKVREYLKISFDFKKSISDAAAAFAAYRVILQDNGIFVFQYPLKSVRGFSLTDKEFPVIVVNSSDSPTAKNFTLFHELCHILFNTGGVFRDFVKEELIMELNEIEKFCNEFASEFLVPAVEMAKQFTLGQDANNKVWDEDKIRSVATLFKVSKEVILRRLLDLNLTNRYQYGQMTKRWNEQYKLLRENRKKQEGGPPYQTLVISHLGKKYVSEVLESYHSGKLDVRRTANFLGVKVNQVSKIEDKIY